MIFTRTWLRYVWAFAIANTSVVCLLSVTFVRPTQGVETFAIFLPFCTLAILWWSPCKILRRSPRRNPPSGSVKRKRGGKIERCHVRYLICWRVFLECVAQFSRWLRLTAYAGQRCKVLLMRDYSIISVSCAFICWIFLIFPSQCFRWSIVNTHS